MNSAVNNNVNANANANASMMVGAEECAICYDVLSGNNNRCTTACGHTYCMTCFIKSTQQNNVCPMCRAELYTPSAEVEDDETEYETEDDEEEENDASEISEDAEVNLEEELAEAQRVLEREIENGEVTSKTEDIAERLMNAGVSFHDLVCYAFSGFHSKVAVMGSASRMNTDRRVERVLDEMDDAFMEMNQMMKEEKRSREMREAEKAVVVEAVEAVAPVHILVPRRKV